MPDEQGVDGVDAQFQRVYDVLHDIAQRKLGAARPEDSLQATGLVHEAWLKLSASQGSVESEDTQHFFATAARAMRWILVDRARRRLAQKRQHERAELELAELPEATEQEPEFVLELDRALQKLEGIDARKCQVVMLRHFAGRSVEETAEELSISRATVKREWAFARAWLLGEIRSSSAQ